MRLESKNWFAIQSYRTPFCDKVTKRERDGLYGGGGGEGVAPVRENNYQIKVLSALMCHW